MKLEKIFLSIAAALALSFTLGTSGCDTLKGANPVTPAVESGRPEVIAYALEGTYTTIQARAADLVEDPDTPAAVTKVIKCVAERANPILDEAKPLAKEAEELRAKVAAGSSDKERLAIVLHDLNEDVTKVAPLVNDLVAAVVGGKAQGECS